MSASVAVEQEDDIDRSPATLSAWLATGAALVALLALGLSAPVAVAPGAVGLVVVAAGAFVGSRRVLLLGSLVLLCGVFVAGAEGGGAIPLLVGTLGAVLSWDVGENGIGLGAQLGREADTRRAELAHATSSFVVGVVAVALGYGAYVASVGGQPITALVFLLVGIVVLVSALR